MRLRYVVVDELHTLRGVFGSHVAHVLRRLAAAVRALRRPTRRSASPARPSATRPSWRPRCAGCRSTRSTTTARRRPERGFAVWQRPLLDAPHRARARRPNVETAMLLARFVADGHQTLAFTRSRRGAELVAAQARGMLDETRAAGAAPAVAAYRAGYLADERRELEAQLTARRARRGRRHQRARARDRRRRPRRGGAQRLPRHARVDAAAGRAAPGAPDAAGRRGARRRRRPARPVVRARTRASSSTARPRPRW